MAIEVITDGYLSVNAVDLSDHVESMTLTYSSELQDATVFGNTSRARLGGLKDWELSVNFRQDFASAKVDATLFSLVGTQTAIKVRKSKTDAIAATNPEFQGNGLIDSYPIIGAKVGEVHNTTVTFKGSDGVALIRDTTP